MEVVQPILREGHSIPKIEEILYDLNESTGITLNRGST